MRLAAKWRTSWTIHANGIDQGRIESVRIDSEWVDVVRLGRGDPLVLVPGWAGSWKLLFPLAQMLAPYFDVILPGLRGDALPCGDLESHPRPVCGVGDYARDLAFMDRSSRDLSALLSCVSRLGGAIAALEYAAEHPRRLSALILAL